jgi:hypothetical protein
MSLIRIEGPRDKLLSLVDIPNLGLRARAAVELPNGNWTVGANATDQAIAEVQARGCTVTVILTDEQIQQRQQIAMTQVGDDGSVA